MNLNSIITVKKDTKKQSRYLSVLHFCFFHSLQRLIEFNRKSQIRNINLDKPYQRIWEVFQISQLKRDIVSGLCVCKISQVPLKLNFFVKSFIVSKINLVNSKQNFHRIYQNRNEQLVTEKSSNWCFYIVQYTVSMIMETK